MIKIITVIMKWTMETLSTLKLLLSVLLKKNLEICMSDGEEIIMKDNITVDDLAEAIADLTIEVKVLEAKVQRLSEFRDTAGYVPISESGGKQ